MGCWQLARALVIGLMMVGNIAPAARAQNLYERLVSPGPVIKGHAKLEKDCGQCHEPFSRTSQTRLCLACHDHKDIAADRLSHTRFHGREPDAAKLECTQCHTDHKGRDVDIVLLDPQTFNHAFTNFELRGAHRIVPCAGCHAPNVKFRDAPGRCYDCHKADDPHKGRLGQSCGDCHGEDTWDRQKPYDHDKTKFPLRGAHRNVACDTCHVGERYKGIGTGCADCHKIQDVHVGRYGPKCQNCHDQNKWKTITFNHDRDTKYPLRGAHVKVKCDTCHTGDDIYHENLGTTCIACHRKDDRHAGQEGTRCEQCHNEDNWRQVASFDHDLTRFPLIGQHAIVACEECHLSLRYKDASLDCASCHQDDHHEGRLTPNCALCHNPNGWALWRFDHDKQTKYPLTGKHRGLDCQACHVAKHLTKITLATNCYSCHQKDDVHHGALGTNCERCHVTSSFDDVAKR
ncbi:MAG TPA: cytochrome c3 family protein [Xanthobacteraceae bacterium]